MRVRGTGLILAATALVVLAATGCSGDGQADGGSSPSIPEQNGLAVGTEAPDFRLKNQEQETIVLSDYRGTKNVVLVFYPADFTPV